VAVVDASMTPTTHAAFIGEVWADEALDAVQFAGMIQKKVTREYEGEIKRGGDTVHISRTSNLQTSTKAPGIGNTIVFEAPTEGEQSLVIDTHEYAAFLLERITEVQAKANLRQKYTNKIGYALSRGREVKLANMFQSLSQSVGAYGVELTTEDLAAGWTAMVSAGLFEASETPSDDFAIFLSPQAYAGLLKIDVLTNRDYNPKADAIGRAYVGSIYGFPVFVSNLLRSPAGGQHDGVIMHRGAFALAVQDLVEVKSQWLIRNIADGVVGWNIYGTAELNYPPETPGGGAALDNRGILVKSL
jgi:hypothetical protein